ncbi:MAG: hypothetical protein WBP41_11860, partial [Saprospiraceae bacterium]
WISISCDCIMTPIEEHIRDTEFIIEGKVVRLLDSDQERMDFNLSNPNFAYRVQIEIIKCYKGGLDNGQIIELNSDYTNCSLYFELSGKYLLFLNKSQNQNEFTQRTCSYNEKMKNARKFIKSIKKTTNPSCQK